MTSSLSPSSASELVEEAEASGNASKLVDIIQACSSHSGDDDWTEAAEESLDALFRLGRGSAVSFPEGTLKTLFDSITSWKEEEAIVEVALGCMVSVLANKTYQAASDKKSSAVDVTLLWTILQDFPNESTILEQACLVIEGLALASSQWKDTLLAARASGAVAAELKGARERITNERNKAYPGRAAEVLGVSLE